MSSLVLRFVGPARNIKGELRSMLADHSTTDREAIARTVTSMIGRVRRDGDRALLSLTHEFDHVQSPLIEVPHAERRDALMRLDPETRSALERCVASLERVQQAFLPEVQEVESSPGVVVGRRPDPLQRIGVYAPGGRAPYPSSVLMGAIPARVAGVGEVILCSPPREDGTVPQIVLAASELAGVDRVFALGGVAAIAAMAYGTETVPSVDRIVGPGNVWTTEAKAQVARVTGIDLLAGPSELLVIADGSADTEFIAREMLAQAEHDPDACVVAVLIGTDADGLLRTLARLEADYVRRAVIHEALRSRGAVVTVGTREDAVSLANAFAPEHVLLAMDDADSVLPVVRAAGTVLVGNTGSVTFSDYATGANHVLPTGGSARITSGLSAESFFRWTTYQRIDRTATERIAADVVMLAAAESFDGHVRAADAWRRKA